MKEVENNTGGRKRGQGWKLKRTALYQHCMTQMTRMDVLRVLLVFKYQSSEQVSMRRRLKEGSLMAEADLNSALLMGNLIFGPILLLRNSKMIRQNIKMIRQTLNS